MRDINGFSFSSFAISKDHLLPLGCENCAATALVRIFGSASKLEEVFFQKMKNEITLKGDALSQLDFNLAPQDIVLNCSDGQV